MENSSDRSKQSGNTKQIAPAKKWCFTLNNWNEKEYDTILKVISSNSSNIYIIGKEIGENGTKHLQGFIKFPIKCRPFKIFDNKRIHWEKCRGSEKDNIIYCSKDGDYTTNTKVPKNVTILEDKNLYNWQKKIIDIIKKNPDDRTIHWFWEPNGCAGKTTFCKYLSVKYGAIPIEGKKNDILFCAANFDSDIYLFDFERDMEDYISYAAMEKIKNGYYMCAKYESKPIIRNCPHVLCFANFPPDTSRLSEDRWKITRLSEEKKLITDYF